MRKSGDRFQMKLADLVERLVRRALNGQCFGIALCAVSSAS